MEEQKQNQNLDPTNNIGRDAVNAALAQSNEFTTESNYYRTLNKPSKFKKVTQVLLRALSILVFVIILFGALLSLNGLGNGHSTTLGPYFWIIIVCPTIIYFVFIRPKRK